METIVSNHYAMRSWNHLNTEWCGSPPASEADIKAAEERSIYRVLSTTEIALFPVAQPQWFATWMEGMEPAGESSVSDELYFDYEAASKHPVFRQEYLPDCLAISEVGDSAIILLNSRVVTDAGEWEASLCATWACRRISIPVVSGTGPSDHRE
jgi:hypothetical protein